MNADFLIETVDLCKFYNGGKIKALNGLSTGIKKGEVECLGRIAQIAQPFYCPWRYLVGLVFGRYAWGRSLLVDSRLALFVRRRLTLE